MNKKFSKRFFHIVIALAAIANLVLLFVFNYGLSNTTPAEQAAERAATERAARSGQNSSESAASDKEPNSSAESGAETEPAAEKPSESSSSSAAKESGTAGSVNKVTGSDSAAAAAETASVNTGTGRPSITLTEDLPVVALNDLDNIARIFSDLDYLTADDGYGKDISDQVTSEYTKISDDPATYRVTFSVTNQAGRTDTKSCTLTVEGTDEPILELTDYEISLPVGSGFSFMRYVKTATDIDGSSLTNNISLSGSVDTGTPGDYEITYSTNSRVNGNRVKKTLIVHVI